MTTAHHLTRELVAFEYLKDQLRAQFPDADEDTIAGTAEGESNLDTLLIAVMRSADEDGLLVAGIKARVEELNERRKRIERRIETKEAIVLHAMERANLKKLEAPDFTVSTRATPKSVIITDESLIPDDYMVQPEPPLPRPDKAGIAVALKAGQAIPGASLSNGGVTLSVRRK